eukprot:6203351-Pleurochrysis_carterae.AAC.3
MGAAASSVALSTSHKSVLFWQLAFQAVRSATHPRTSMTGGNRDCHLADARLSDWLREAELKHCRVCMLATVRAPPRRPFTHPFRLLVDTPAQPHVVVMTLHILADVAAIVWLSIGCTLASLRLANSNALHANPCLWSFRLFAVSAASQVGFVFTDFLTLPGSIYQVSTLDAHDVSVASGSMSQLLLWIGARTGAVSPPSGRHDFNST